jgi:hypothetical protein
VDKKHPTLDVPPINIFPEELHDIEIQVAKDAVNAY